MGCVYLATSPSGKQYVGMTVQPLRQRWNEHVCSANHGSTRAFQRALRKYGPDAFKVEVLHEAADREVLAALEVKEIAEKGTLFPHGYNLTTGGELNFSHVPDVRRRVSEAKRKQWEDPDYRESMVACLVARSRSQEGREAASERANKQWASPAHRELVSAKVSATFSTPEARAMLSARTSKCWQDPAYRARVTEGMARKRQDPAYRARMSAAAKRKWEDPSFRERVLSQHMKQCSVVGVLYPSVNAAAAAVGISPTAMTYRLKSATFPDHFITKKENESVRH